MFRSKTWSLTSLNAPLIAEGWNDFFSIVRDNNSLPGAMRELFVSWNVILQKQTWNNHYTRYWELLFWTMRHMNGMFNHYWISAKSSIISRIQHESVGRSEGLTTSQLLAIRLSPPFSVTKEQAATLGLELVAALTFTDWITINARVPDSVFKNLKQFLNDQQIVEAVATTGGYNLVSRFVVALDVDEKMNVAVPIPK